MKHVKFYLLGTVVLAAGMYAEQAVAMSIAMPPATLLLSPVVVPASEGDDREEPDEGYECDDGYPFCEVH